jgi:hypothetical protein
MLSTTSDSGRVGVAHLTSWVINSSIKTSRMVVPSDDPARPLPLQFEIDNGEANFMDFLKSGTVCQKPLPVSKDCQPPPSTAKTVVDRAAALRIGSGQKLLALENQDNETCRSGSAYHRSGAKHR